MASNTELKQRFLELLKSDEEFRLAVAGLLGLDTVISELKKLREDFQVFMKEQEKRWIENSKRWEENNRRWEENNRRWEGAFKRFEAIESEIKRLWEAVEKLREDFLTFVKEQEKKWEEHNRRWEENNKRWEENWRRWEENSRFWEENWRRWKENDRKWEEAFKRFEAIEKKLEEHDKRFARIELALGALSEATLTKFVYEEVEKFARESEEKIVARKRNTKVNGAEVDMLIETDKTVYIVEVKIKPRRRHVNEFLKKIELVQKAFTKPVKPILAGVYIGDEVEVYARSRGVEVIKY
jgi:exonuclease VII large subunit